MTPLPFVQAKNFHRGRARSFRLLVVHDMEAGQGPKTAENVASWFAGKSAPMASAHFCHDQDSTVQCVKLGDTAFGAPKANADGIHFELAGRAAHGRGDWLNKPNDNMLTWAACEMALIFGLYRYLRVPVELKRLSVAEIKAGRSGFVGHADVSAAYTPGGHTDPGGNFPWDVLIGKVRWWVGTFDAHGWPEPNYRV